MTSSTIDPQNIPKAVPSFVKKDGRYYYNKVWLLANTEEIQRLAWDKVTLFCLFEDGGVWTKRRITRPMRPGKTITLTPDQRSQILCGEQDPRAIVFFDGFMTKRELQENLLKDKYTQKENTSTFEYEDGDFEIQVSFDHMRGINYQIIETL